MASCRKPSRGDAVLTNFYNKYLTSSENYAIIITETRKGNKLWDLLQLSPL